MPAPKSWQHRKDDEYIQNKILGIMNKVTFNVEVPQLGECWEWMGATNSAGYGITSIALINGPRVTIGVHRLLKTFAEDREEIPALECHHRCMNPSCCNPTHLYWMPVGNHRVWEAVQQKIWKSGAASVSASYVAKNTKMTKAEATKMIEELARETVEPSKVDVNSYQG